ncbi:unnamed protein product [Rotaria socialis]|uniref:Sulfotransferase n=1 Tax=Rotaria socialis TaxID=392032 RepID=A0A817YQX7_9BILA|nr:unnamed protein product [Rotaria socialis]CAF3383472.1 unnamed protein product [Rotaria socialis]CAF3449807.1 unnamed protein product [Rotaria socialis]CAF3451488.1 unnamed protein product [Rotaria socialis]CAF3456096.1 unnamed protein product [Rotaria socialis]
MSGITSDQVTNKHPSLVDDTIFHENDLDDEAKHQFSFHSEILKAFEINRRSLLGNDKMTPVGRHILFSMFNSMHTTCKRMLNYAAVNNQLLHFGLPEKGPLIICGLPRTGSTLLYNLLSCDPNCRAPLVTDMMGECIPPIPRSNVAEHQQRALTVQFLGKSRNQLVNRSNNMAAAHPSFPIEEDTLIFFQAGLSSSFMLTNSYDPCELNTWIYDETNKDYAYDYHKVYLHLLNAVDMPHSHWLLKWSRHLLYLDTVFEHYPNAAIILTHRNLVETIPSWCQFMWTLVSAFYEETDLTSKIRATTQAIRYIDKLIECLMILRTKPAYIERQSKKAILDVLYDDIMEQPIAAVRHIYDYFGFSWSPEFEAAMQSWLRENPQGKQGRHTYSLAEFGLTQDEIETRYADYIKTFLRSPSRTDLSLDALDTQ